MNNKINIRSIYKLLSVLLFTCLVLSSLSRNGVSRARAQEAWTDTPTPADTSVDTPIPAVTDTSVNPDMPGATSTPIPAVTDTSANTEISAATSTPLPAVTDTPVNTDTPAAASTPAPAGISGSGVTAIPTATETQTPVVNALIVGGAPASPGEWPWQVALVGSDAPANDFYSGPGYQFCSGSLIDPQWVITAAHCITDDSNPPTYPVVSPSSLDVVAGIYDLYTPAAGFQRRHVVQIIRHPSFNFTSLDYDVALLKLDSPVSIGGSGATKTALIPLVQANIGSLVGTNSEVTGWGNTISSGNSNGYPHQLYKVQLPIIANSICNNASHYNGQITGNMLCAGYDAGGHDSCDGDSGGPLVVQNAGQWKLAGIVSWGYGCAQPNLEGVYTRVSQFGSWVNTQMGPVTLLGPSGAQGANYTPTYSWNPMNNMTDYDLYINGPGGTKVFEQWYTAAQLGCSNGISTCTITPATPLGGGAFTWWVQTWNPAGLGAWSSGMDFNTTVFTGPGTASLNSPSGSIGTNSTPTYSWNQVSGATYYYLWVDGPSGNVIKQWFTSAQTACNGSTCSITPAITLPAGAYTWWVQTWNAAGYGAWSTAKNFSTTSPATPGTATLNSPSGSIGTNSNPTYTWNQVSNSASYYLWVDGPGGNVIKQWYDSNQTACNGSTCSITPATTLSAGAYTWWIQTWNSAGYGSWSSPTYFNTSAPVAPGGAALISPTGYIGKNPNPTYSWNQVPGSTSYYLWVDGPGGNVIKQWYTSVQASCNGTTCYITNPAILPAGAYSWWIQTWNSVGYGPWSSAMSFSLSP